MSQWERWQTRDPLEVLMRRGEDCTNCCWIKAWDVHWKTVQACDKGREMGKRCEHWRHKNAPKEKA